MSPLREILANAEATKLLLPRYRAFTTCVGLVGGAIGIYAWYVGSEMVADLAGISLAHTMYSSDDAGWIVAWLVVGGPLIIYLAIGVVAALAGVVMVFLGHMIQRDLLLYVLMSRYPPDWFKEAG